MVIIQEYILVVILGICGYHTGLNSGYYKTIQYGTIQDGLLIQELSGITWNSIDSTYYPVSDEFIDNKGFYGFNIGIDADGATLEYGDMILMNYPDIDSEGIVFIKNTYDEDNSYFLIAAEGNTDYNTSNRLLLYSANNGTFLIEVTDQLPDRFTIDIEGLSIDPEQECLVFSTELSLISDRIICENCVRISVNDISINKSTDDIVVIDELYELRYDLDTTIIPNAQWSLSDIVVFQENDKLYGLVLERLTIVIDADQDLENYDNKIYLVDLTLNNSMYDIKDQTINVTAIEKTLLFTFSADVDSTIFTPIPICTNTPCLNILNH